MKDLHKMFMLALLEQLLYRSDADEKPVGQTLQTTATSLQQSFWLFQFLTVE